ncbi:CD160 antigen [Ochotona curzoniae]|uniref:CD160 antigen n=1 Tax=Ochotona curzoniae TaxID=130825 RepID=UPI001B34B0B1|nr:CD160 antigen [Ochotona curzoniae]
MWQYEKVMAHLKSGGGHKHTSPDLLSASKPAGLSHPSSPPILSSFGQLNQCLEQADGPGAWHSFVQCILLCYQDSEVKDTSGANICFEFLGLLTTYRIPMTPGKACYILAILLATVDIQPGGCVHIIASAEQEGKQLKLICTLWHTKEEAEGIVVFLCKDKSLHCSPETSLQQLRLPRELGISNRSEMPSQLVFTIHPVMPSDSGTYQCCASSQNPDRKFQGHFFSVHVSETGNWTVTGLKQRQQPEFPYNKGSLSTGFLQEKVWMLLLTSLAVPPAWGSFSSMI